jgi:hypothetical protein
VPDGRTASVELRGDLADAQSLFNELAQRVALDAAA